MKYKVIGDCDVADVPPGGTVTDEQLAAHRAQVQFLVGTHLEPVADEPKKAEAKKL